MTDRPLSILHFSTADILGGSARSAYRIHSGLREAGHRSRMLVGIKLSDDPDVDTVCGNGAERLANRVANKLGDTLGYQYMFHASDRRVLNHPWVSEADIVQLYNIHGGYLSLSVLPQLSRRAPMVWRLSDLWPMTGHCAYPGSCERWHNGCGECPDLNSYPAIKTDRTAFLFRQKEKAYRNCAITIVAPSSWTEKCAKESPLLGRFPVTRIPNGLDGRAFQPSDRAQARKKLGIEPDKKAILFSAHILDNNPRKGGDVLIEALNRLKNPRDHTLLLVGEGGESWTDRVPLEVHLMGFVDAPQSLADIYAACDVVAIPSVVENLPNVLIEALACGRAVVASDTGGMRDGVRHTETGYLAKPEAVGDFAAGLTQILDDNTLRHQMEEKSRDLFDRVFCQEIEVSRFLELYTALAAEKDGMNLDDFETEKIN